jgi:hypothetical protein
MLKTYTLFLRGQAGGHSQFEPVTCATDGEALQSARRLLSSRPECEAIDVYFGDMELFRVTQDSRR